MPSHDYTARQALELLLARLTERDQEVRTEIISAINAGKDIEQPLFVNSTADNFRPAGLGAPDSRQRIAGSEEKRPPMMSEPGADHEKTLEIEIETETTQVPASREPTLRLDRIPVSQIAQQQQNLSLLSEMLSF